MFQNNNYNYAGFIFLFLWVGLILFLSGNVVPDLTTEDFNTGGIGHPLTQ